MKKTIRILCLVLMVMMAALPVLAQGCEGDPPIAPEIQLPANPTTGYTWHCTVEDPAVLDVCDQGYYPTGDNEMLGAGGWQLYRLDGAEEGMTIVTFTYARSWEAEPLYSLAYYVQVDAHGNAYITQMSFDY